MQVIVPLLLFSFLLYCVLDVVLTAEDRVKNLPKLIWLLLVVLLPVIGGIAWLLAGRPEGQSRAPGGKNATGGTAHPRHPANQPRSSAGSRKPKGSGGSRPPRGPDDDPEFIRQLEQRLRRRDDDPPAA